MDIELLKLVLTAANVGAGTVVLALLLREHTKMLLKMIDTLTDLVDKLGTALAEDRQTMMRLREFVEEGKENARYHNERKFAGRPESSNSGN